MSLMIKLNIAPDLGAGLTDHVWDLDEVCATVRAQASAAKRIDKGIILKALELKDYAGRHTDPGTRRNKILY
jgi:hypothetical protein